MTDSCVLNIVRKYRNNRSRDSPFRGTLYKKNHFKRFWGITPTFLHLQCESKNWTLFHLVQMVQDRAIVTMASQK